MPKNRKMYFEGLMGNSPRPLRENSQSSPTRSFFSISSVLVEDLDFTQQPVAKHLDRARFIGVKYIVATSSRVKKILAEEPLITARQDFGTWSVFELQEKPLSRAQVLPYKPALVLSTLSLKQRKRNEFDFVRFAEEQFVDDWFDVLLARSNESKIDRLPELDRFGALIVENYDYGDEDSAFEKLRVKKEATLGCFSDTTPVSDQLKLLPPCSLTQQYVCD